MYTLRSQESDRFYARDFSMSWLHYGGTYLLSVADLPSAYPKEGSYQVYFHEKAWLAYLCDGRDLNPCPHDHP